MGFREEAFSIDLGALKRRVLNAAMPEHSLISGLPFSDEDALLWQCVKFLDEPCCECCGFPFEFDAGVNLCARCHVKQPHFDHARGAIIYEDASRKIVLDFKHGGRTDGLKFFSAQMARAGRSLIAESNFMIPVPLHKARLRKRKFNQSALLARALFKQTGLPYETSLLLRGKNTDSQGGKTFIGRKRNVQGAFYVPKVKQKYVQGKTILLIDDVYTSGATLNACALSLKRAGAVKINALTLMRVVRPVSITT